MKMSKGSSVHGPRMASLALRSQPVACGQPQAGGAVLPCALLAVHTAGQLAPPRIALLFNVVQAQHT